MDSKAIIARDDAHVLHTYARSPLALVRGEGLYAYDAEGRRYLDFTSGIGVNALGYCHPAWVRAVAAQAGQLQHTSNLYYTAPCGALATLTATGQDVFHHDFGPFPEKFAYVPAGDFAALQAAAAPDTCAVLLELVQGEGGVVALEKDYVARVAQLCQERDILLLVDEVQTGVGRTGTFLACEQYGLQPDIVTLAKGLGGGLPIGAVLLTRKVAEHMGPGSHGSTFGGNPVACAGALAVLDTLDETLLQNVRDRAAQLRAGLAALPFAAQVTGLGLMAGVALRGGVSAATLRAACEARGLLVLTAKDRLRLLPPLTLTAQHVDEALAVLRAAGEGMA